MDYILLYGRETSCNNSGRNVRDGEGNVCNSGEIEYALRNLRLEIVNHNFA